MPKKSRYSSTPDPSYESGARLREERKSIKSGSSSTAPMAKSVFGRFKDEIMESLKARQMARRARSKGR